MIQPPPCDKHELNELNCVECTEKRKAFYESAIPDDVLYYGDEEEDDE
jgi:hypothetical protein